MASKRKTPSAKPVTKKAALNVATRKKPLTAAEKMRRYRAKMRAMGMKPVQIWVPDTSRPGFWDEYRRQARSAAAADRESSELAWLDAVDYSWIPE